jgi:hypothetical protein
VSDDGGGGGVEYTSEPKGRDDGRTDSSARN